MKILCIGYTWRGANEGSLFKALSQNGHIVSIIETNNFFPTNANSLTLKVLDKIIYKIRIKNFNNAIIKQAQEFKPDIALFYKSPETLPETIKSLKKIGIFTVNVYPDVSFFTHGKNLVKTIPYYNLIISTKSFAKFDLKNSLGLDHVEFVPHGFDPDIHKHIKNSNNSQETDVSFIGIKSPSKEMYIHHLITSLPMHQISVWGSGWNNSMIIKEKNATICSPIFGDQYALMLSNTKIALGLLSEKVAGASSGDLITARTFEIPGIGTFMLHQRTEEVINYFEEDKEIVCFSSKEELADKAKYYLKNENKRLNIAHQGYLRAHRDHTYQKRALEIIDIINKYL